MRNLFSSKVRIVLVVAVLCALLTIGCKMLWTGTAAPMNNVFAMVVNPMRNGVTLLIDRAERIYDYVFNYELLCAENDLLREEMAEKNQDIREAQTYKEENDRLRTLLELSEKNTDYDFEIANVVAWGSTTYSSTMTISKGSKAGVEAGMCAVTEGGQVVGLVTETGTNWATVTTILDPDSEIGAYVFGSGYTCIAQGDLELAPQGEFRASYLNTAATIRNGDQVLTSGDGDIYPPGLVLGSVTDVGTDEVTVSKYAILQPSEVITGVEQVFIIKSYDNND